MTKLVVRRGDTLELAVGPIVDGDGVAQNITGSTVRFTAKDRYDDLDAAAIITGSTSDGRVTIPTQTGDNLGRANVKIPGTATDVLAAAIRRVLHWDVQISQPDGAVHTLDAGLLYVERDVTRSS